MSKKKYPEGYLVYGEFFGSMFIDVIIPDAYVKAIKLYDNLNGWKQIYRIDKAGVFKLMREVK